MGIFQKVLFLIKSALNGFIALTNVAIILIISTSIKWTLILHNHLQVMDCRLPRKFIKL